MDTRDGSETGDERRRTERAAKREERRRRLCVSKPGSEDQAAASQPNACQVCAIATHSKLLLPLQRLPSLIRIPFLCNIRMTRKTRHKRPSPILPLYACLKTSISTFSSQSFTCAVICAGRFSSMFSRFRSRLRVWNVGKENRGLSALPSLATKFSFFTRTRCVVATHIPPVMVFNDRPIFTTMSPGLGARGFNRPLYSAPPGLSARCLGGGR